MWAKGPISSSGKQRRGLFLFFSTPIWGRWRSLNNMCVYIYIYILWICYLPKIVKGDSHSNRNPVNPCFTGLVKSSRPPSWKLRGGRQMQVQLTATWRAKIWMRTCWYKWMAHSHSSKIKLFKHDEINMFFPKLTLLPCSDLVSPPCFGHWSIWALNVCRLFLSALRAHQKVHIVPIEVLFSTSHRPCSWSNNQPTSL